MFAEQKITIKSGEGKNFFEATVELNAMAGKQEIDASMAGLRAMQKDRMEWAARNIDTPKK